MSPHEEWSIISKNQESSESEPMEPPPYENEGDAKDHPHQPQPPATQSSSSSSTPAPTFCCPFNTSTNLQNDSATILTNHTAYSFRILGPQTDTAIHGKYNRFLLWARHGICRPLPPPSTGGKSIPWVYMIEVLDFRPTPAKQSAQYFVAKADKGQGGFESVPYGRGNNVRMANLNLKASMILKCVEHENWFEINFYC